ncbi:hypothetical protein D3M51_15480 [Klebsiella pneumoniae]|nr:hypothetical protein [Klebsiella pneumoniae]
MKDQITHLPDNADRSVAKQKFKITNWPTYNKALINRGSRHCCKVSDEAAFCLIQRPYISKTLLTRRISPRGSP